MKKMSVIIPCFNREFLISETLDSLLKQTYSNWECIVVDDGSTDNTKIVVSKYEKIDPRVKLYDRDCFPKGACTCRNQGIDICEGEFVIFLDSDDLLEPFCLEQRVNAMNNNPDLDFSIFSSLMFHRRPNDLGLWWNVDKGTSELTRQFHQDAICQSTGVIWKKESIDRIGRWNEKLYLWQDIELFFRAFIQDYKYKKFFHLPPDLHVRRLETSLSRDDFFAKPKIQSRIEVVHIAVNLLKDYKKETYIKEARYMLAEVISGLSRIGEFSKAKNLIKWGRLEVIFNQSEVESLKWLIFLRYTKLSNFLYFAERIKNIEKLFSPEDCTLGILKHEK